MLVKVKLDHFPTSFEVNINKNLGHILKTTAWTHWNILETYYILPA